MILAWASPFNEADVNHQKTTPPPPPQLGHRRIRRRRRWANFKSTLGQYLPFAGQPWRTDNNTVLLFTQTRDADTMLV